MHSNSLIQDFWLERLCRVEAGSWGKTTQNNTLHSSGYLKTSKARRQQGRRGWGWGVSYSWSSIWVQGPNRRRGNMHSASRMQRPQRAQAGQQSQPALEQAGQCDLSESSRAQGYRYQISWYCTPKSHVAGRVWVSLWMRWEHSQGMHHKFKTFFLLHGN